MSVKIGKFLRYDIFECSDRGCPRRHAYVFNLYFINNLDWQARTMPYEDSFIVVGGRDDVNDVEPVIDIFVGCLSSF